MGNTEQHELNDFLQNSIVEIIEENYNKFTGTNEAILHSSEDIVDFINGVFREVPNSVELLHKSVESEEVKSLSALDYYIETTYPGYEYDKAGLKRKHLWDSKVMEGFASLAVEQDRIKNKKIFDDSMAELLQLIDKQKIEAVEQERKKWEKEKEAYAVDQVAKAIQTMSNKRY